MKNTSLILCILAMMGAISCKNAATTESAAATETAAVAATEGKIVYIDLDRILMEYDMANDLRSVVETKVQNIQAEINRRGQKLEKQVAEYQEKIQKGLMTRSVAEIQGQKLQQEELDFNNYAAQKQQEMAEEQMVMMNQIGDAIKTYLDKFNEEKKFAMILTSQGGTPVITADPSLNITDAVIAGLNAEYVASKNQNNE